MSAANRLPGIDQMRLLLAAGSLCAITACQTPTPSTPDPTPKPTAAATKPAPKPPGFDTAMARHKPLGKVAGAPRDTLELRPLSPDRFESAQTYAEQTGSYALLIWHDGALRYEQYFNGHGPELRAESASMHKTVLALATAAAMDDGLIPGPDAPASTWLTEWRDDERNAIAIKHLLTMSSGLQRLSIEGGINSPRARFFTNGAEARAAVLGLPVEVAPGTRFNYANTDSQLLGLIVERATQRPYEDYLSQRLWQPLGAHDAYVWYNEDNGFPRTYTALLARPRDWLRVGRLIKDGGKFNGQRVVSAGRIENIIAPSPRNPGYGWQVWRGVDRLGKRYYNEEKTGLAVAQSESFALTDLIYLDGYGGQRVYISREHDLVIVRLGDARADWDDAALPNRVARALGFAAP